MKKIKMMAKAPKVATPVGAKKLASRIKSSMESYSKKLGKW